MLLFDHFCHGIILEDLKEIKKKLYFNVEKCHNQNANYKLWCILFNDITLRDNFLKYWHYKTFYNGNLAVDLEKSGTFLSCTPFKALA